MAFYRRCARSTSDLPAKLLKNAGCLGWTVSNGCRHLLTTPVGPPSLQDLPPPIGAVDAELDLKELENILEARAEAMPSEREMELGQRLSLIDVVHSSGPTLALPVRRRQSHDMTEPVTMCVHVEVRDGKVAVRTLILEPEQRITLGLRRRVNRDF